MDPNFGENSCVLSGPANFPDNLLPDFPMWPAECCRMLSRLLYHQSSFEPSALPTGKNCEMSTISVLKTCVETSRRRYRQNMDSCQENLTRARSNNALDEATKLMESHSHVRGLVDLVSIKIHEDCMVVRGVATSYYDKQMIQESLRPVAMQILNEVNVLMPRIGDDECHCS